MIHVDRSKVSAEKKLTDARVRKAEDKIATFLKLSKKGRAQRRPPFDPKCYHNKEVVTALRQLFHGKCAYCETPLDDDSLLTVDQFEANGQHRRHRWPLQV